MAPKRKRTTRVDILPSSPKKSRTKPRVSKSKKVASQPLSPPPMSDSEDDSQSTATSNRDLPTWPEQDMSELLKKIENAIPPKDSLRYKSRVEKIDWDEIAFKGYTASECRETWCNIQKRLRRFRLLREIIEDAKIWISQPWTNFYRGTKNNRHPDMPRRPLSTYMLFYMKKKDKVLKTHPKMDMTEISKLIAEQYKNLSAEEKEKYSNMAASERKKYIKEIEQFYRDHPDQAPKHQPITVKPAQQAVRSGPKKPSTPFRLFYEDRLRRQNQQDLDKLLFLEECKEQWRNLSDKNKVFWIDCALEQETKYLDDLKTYGSENPDFVPGPYKSVLTKEEKLIKERVAGKPEKPPNSAYSLYCRIMLVSEEMKVVSPKERMMTISQMWKTLSDREKKEYGERTKHLLEQYKLEYASYLESLPEDKRLEELQNNTAKKKTGPVSGKPKKKKSKTSSPKNKIKATFSTSTPIVKEEKIDADIPTITNNVADVLFEGEPEPPPATPYLLFVKTFKNQFPEHVKDIDVIWEAMSDVQRNKHREVLKDLKYKYMEDYEKFLKSLTKDELKRYFEMKELKPEFDENGVDKDETSDSSSSSNSSCSDSEDESAHPNGVKSEQESA